MTASCIRNMPSKSEDSNHVSQESDRIFELLIDRQHGVDRDSHREADLPDDERGEGEKQPRRSVLPIGLSQCQERDDDQDGARNFPEDVHGFLRADAGRALPSGFPSLSAQASRFVPKKTYREP